MNECVKHQQRYTLPDGYCPYCGKPSDGQQAFVPVVPPIPYGSGSITFKPDPFTKISVTQSSSSGSWYPTATPEMLQGLKKQQDHMADVVAQNPEIHAALTDAVVRRTKAMLDKTE